MYGQGQQYPQQPGEAPQQNPYGGLPAYPSPAPPTAPYGPPQPPQPNPYAAQPASPAPGYAQPGLPQQPYPNESLPQQPPAQPPYGPPAGWTQTPPPAAPRKSRKGLVAGIVAGVVVVGAAAVGAMMVVGGGSDIQGKYKIDLPATLPGGYVRAKQARQVAADADTAGVGTDMTAISATYSASDQQSILTVIGAYGNISDPKAVLSKVQSELTEKKTAFTRPMTDYPAKDPKDSGGLLRCGILKLSQADVTTCYWVNHATSAMTFFSPTAGGTTPLDPAQAAERTRAARDAMVTAR